MVTWCRRGGVMLADNFGFLTDVGEGELGGVEEVDAADDHTADADETEQHADGSKDTRPELDGECSQARAKQGDESRGGKGGQSDIDGAERLKQQRGLALDTIDLLKQPSGLRVGLASRLGFGEKVAHAITSAQHPIDCAQGEDAGSVGKESGRGNEGEGGKRIFSQ